jgi:hypothetical protein
MITSNTKKIFLCITIFLWTLVCFEVGIRVISNFIPIYTVEMLKYAKKLKIKSTSKNISHEHVSNSSAYLMGVEIKLNSMGHRSAELKKIKPKGEKRIYILGSSMALAWGVKEEDGFVKQLEDKLNKEVGPKTEFTYKTINAGIGNYNTYYQVELFKKQVDLVKPDIAVLQYFINDAEPNPKGTNNFLIRHSLFSGYMYQNFFSTSLNTQTLSHYYASLYKKGSSSWEKTMKSLQDFKLLCDERGIDCIGMLIPDLHNLSSDGPYPPIYEKVVKTFDHLGIPMVNSFSAVSSAFAHNPIKARVAFDDPHPNAAVHRILVEELFLKLETMKLINTGFNYNQR